MRVKPSKVELIPLKPGQFAAQLAEVELARMRLCWMRESLPRLAHVQHPPNRAYFGFLANETSMPVVVNGRSVTADAVFQFGSHLNSNQYSLGPTQWANISVDGAERHGMCRETSEQDLATCDTSYLVIPRRSMMRRLRRLHADAVALTSQSSATLVEPEAARGIENQLMEAMADCLTSPQQTRPTPALARHATVVERFRDLLDTSLDRVLYLPEVCAALGVSHRTLSYCCEDFLGMAPRRYFFLRRIYMVRCALRLADRHATTVTEIATRYGFWEFGRFSAQYKALFGQTPSATLREESRNVEY